MSINGKMQLKSEKYKMKWCEFMAKYFSRGVFVYYAAVALIVVLIKLFYHYCTTGDVLFMLKPVVFLVQSFNGLGFHYSDVTGFVSAQGNIIIDKSCSGINLGVILYAMLSVSFISRFQKTKSRVGMIFVFLAAAYVMTIAANAFRIIISIFLLGFDLSFIPLEGRELHKYVGMVFNFCFLIVFYIMTDKFISYSLKKKNSKGGECIETTP